MQPPDDFDKAINDDAAIERALGLGVRDALRLHKAMGVPIAVARDGRVVWIPPEEIVIPDDDEGETAES